MKILKYILIFLVPFILTTLGILMYFSFRGKLSGVKIPDIPNLPIADLIKLSRFSLEKPPSQSLVGSITKISGEVSYEPRLATESSALKEITQVRQGDLFETGGDGALTILFDSVAEIKMGAETSVNVIQTLPVNLVFSQTKGSVEYEKLGQLPISIKAGRMLVEQDGLIKVVFNEEDSEISVTVVAGSVIIAYNNLKNESQLIKVSAGRTFIFNNTQRRGIVVSN